MQAKLTNFERIHVWMCTIERVVAWPLLVVSLLSAYARSTPALISALFAFRIARGAYAHAQLLYAPVGVTFCVCKFALHNLLIDTMREQPLPSPPPSRIEFLASIGVDATITPLLVLYIVVSMWPKVRELTLKLNFILVYMAPVSMRAKHPLLLPTFGLHAVCRSRDLKKSARLQFSLSWGSAFHVGFD